MEWRKIETAPKDGTVFLAWNGEVCTMQMWDGTEYGEESLFVYSDELMQDVCPSAEQPTHWMPLPEPPKCK